MPDILVTFEATFNLANKVIGWIPKVGGSLIFSQLSDRRTVDRMVMLWQIGAENRQDQSLVCPTPTHQLKGQKVYIFQIPIRKTNQVEMES